MMDLSNFEVVGEIILEGHDGIVWGMAWHPSGTILASCGQDKTIKLWTFMEGAWRLSDELQGGHTRTIRSLAFSPDGKRLAAAGFDGIVSIWVQSRTAAGWKCVASLEGHENEVKSVCWSPDGRILSTCGRDKTIWIWEINPQDDDALESDDLDFECLAVLAEHTQDVKCVAFSPNDSRTLVSASYDDTVKIWSENMDAEWICKQTLNDHRSTVWAASFSHCGNFLFTVGDDCRIVVHGRDMNSNKSSFCTLTEVANAHERAILTISLAPVVPRDEFGEESSSQQSIVFATVGSRILKCWSFSPVTNNVQEIGSYQCVDRTDLNFSVWNPKIPNLLSLAGDSGFLRILKVDFK